MARKIIAVRDPRICRCCVRRITDQDIKEYQAQVNDPDYKGLPEMCDGCAACCNYDKCLTEEGAALNCHFREARTGTKYDPKTGKRAS